MSQSNYDELAREWLDDLTGPQSRALSHQVGISGAITFPVEKLRKLLTERKTFKKVKKVYNEHVE